MNAIVAWVQRFVTDHPVLTTVFLVISFMEFGVGRVAPRSALYGGWKRVVETLGAFWTAVILGVVYFVSVSLVSAFMRLRGEDPLDRALDGGSAWRPHEPNPLGPLAAARHQF